MASMGLFVLSPLRFHYDCGIVTGDVYIAHLDALRLFRHFIHVGLTKEDYSHPAIHPSVVCLQSRTFQFLHDRRQSTLVEGSLYNRIYRIYYCVGPWPITSSVTCPIVESSNIPMNRRCQPRWNLQRFYDGTCHQWNVPRSFFFLFSLSWGNNSG